MRCWVRKALQQVVHDVVREALNYWHQKRVGIMGTLNAKTLEYTKTREQFGVAIGSFKHSSTAWLMQ